MSTPESNTLAPASPAPAPKTDSPPPTAPAPQASPPVAPAHSRPWKLILGIPLLIIAIVAASLLYVRSLNTVSTDDAYVNGHVTFVAPRVSGQVSRVLVDDNNRVRKGDLLVQLDRGPLQAEVNIAQSMYFAAQADLFATVAQTRGLEGQTRSLRFGLQHAMEDVDNQVALLHARVAALESQKASLNKAQADYNRGQSLIKSNAITPEELDQRKAAFLVAQARVEEALQTIYQTRVSLGLPPKPETGDDLTQVPADLDQTFSSVRQAQASLVQSAAQLGVWDSLAKSPKQMVDDFHKRDPDGNIDRIYDQLVKSAPGIKQAETKVAAALANLEQAQLNLSYCNIYAEIDGVITRRNINPGNNVVAGQSLMAIRSLTDIWIDANYKETELRDLRIGQNVNIEVDMYGRHKRFKGRISGFTMGTGSTLALLPAQNATGNFVKVVQRLPVRIDLIDYDPDELPLFIGLSVSPAVLIKEQPTGPNAGKILQPYIPTTPATSAPSTTAPATLPGSAP